MITISAKNVVTMSTLGKAGRFGNQIFQYAFLKIYAAQYGVDVETSPWLGQLLFGHRDPPISQTLPSLHLMQPSQQNPFKQNLPPYLNVDFTGQYMWHTKYFRPYKHLFLSLFEPIPEFREKMDEAMKKLGKMGKTHVGIHIRRGDFLKYKNHPSYVPVPTDWYVKWLDQVWPNLDNPVLYLASDDLSMVKPDFKRFCPITSKDLFVDFPDQPKFNRIDPSIYPDFYTLTQCRLLAISNSSFSFAASLLNSKAHTFMRPHANEVLVRYEPWDSRVKLKLL